MSQVRNESNDIELLPPDPSWRPPRDSGAIVYDVVEQVAGPEVVRVAEPPPDPRVIGRLMGLGWRLLAIALAAALLIYVLEPFGPDPIAQVIAWLRQAGWWGRGIVVVGIALLCPLFVPVGPLTLIPGYVFGGARAIIRLRAGLWMIARSRDTIPPLPAEGRTSMEPAYGGLDHLHIVERLVQ